MSKFYQDPLSLDFTVEEVAQEDPQPSIADLMVLCETWLIEQNARELGFAVATSRTIH